jgi:hypothetical protein
MTGVFSRPGSKRRFTVRAKGLSTKKATLVVPDVTSDLVVPIDDETPLMPTDNLYRMRLVTKFGASKKLSSLGASPIIGKNSNAPSAATSAPAGDCDHDGIVNSADTDDDNDFLLDTQEQAIGTDVCNTDTDGDGPTDYYEYRVAFEFNGGPTLPYPALRPYPNPLVPDSDIDFDGDGLSSANEFKAWQFTGSMGRFYSDANQDSDGDGVLDGAGDEDHDLLPNLVELNFLGEGNPAPLNWLRTDTDGDGLCDGLDDQDHDGPPTPLSVADCTTAVPNNGPSGTPPSPSGAGDPNPALIDGDDNMYSNYYEWMTSDNLDGAPVGDPCLPSIYPVSPYCPATPVFQP